MKRTALLLVTLLCCSTILLFADSQNKNQSTNKHNASVVARWTEIGSFRSAWSQYYPVLPPRESMGLILPNAFSIDGRIR